jgi:hypothetical protein
MPPCARLQVPPDSVPMLQASNWREALRDRTTNTPLEGPDSILPRHRADLNERHLHTNYADEYARQVNDTIPAAGFKFEPTIEFNPLPYPAETGSNRPPDPNRHEKFGQFHKTSAIQMFKSFRESDQSRLGLKSEVDDLGPGVYP